MKKYLGFIFVLLFPYIFALGMGGVLLLANVFGDIVIPFLVFLAVFAMIIVISLVINVIIVINSVRKQRGAHELATATMIIKLVQIPAYVAVYLLGCIYAIGLFHAAIIAVVLFSVVDGISVALSGSIGATAAWRGYRENLIDKKTMIVLGISQFVFCLDVIAAIVLFVKTRKTL